VLDLPTGQVVSVRVEYGTSVAISIPGTPVQPHLELVGASVTEALISVTFRARNVGSRRGKQFRSFT
jgi:hypothetical protein